MKRLLLAPAIALPFFLVSCNQPGWTGDSGGGPPPSSQNGFGATVGTSRFPMTQAVWTWTWTEIATVNPTSAVTKAPVKKQAKPARASLKTSTPSPSSSSYRPEPPRQQQSVQRQVDTATSAS